MLRKRLIGVITVRNGWAVQSISYCRYLPLGRPWWIAEQLDRWGVDEILVQVIDRTSRGMGPDFELLDELQRARLSTPLIYGGGVTSKADAIAAVNAGADRITLDAVLHDTPHEVKEIAEYLGAQAVIASLPVTYQGDDIAWYDYRARESRKFSKELLRLFADAVVSEALIIDWEHEGQPKSFQDSLIRNLPFEVPLIVFGGISESAQVQCLLADVSVVAVAIGNFLNYHEHAVQHLKASVLENVSRTPHYQTTL